MDDQQAIAHCQRSLEGYKEKADQLRELGKVIGLDTEQENMLTRLECEITKLALVIEKLQDGDREGARMTLLL